MEGRIDNGTEEFQFWQDIFKFRKKFYELETDEEAQEMVDATLELGRKYADTPIEDLVVKVTVAVVNYTEGKWKKNGKKKNNV